MIPRSRVALGGLLLGLVGIGVDASAQGTRVSEEVVAVGGADIYYRSLGEGPPLLLLHGYHGAGQLWEPYVGLLQQGYRLIIPDLRGHGRSTNPSQQFSHRLVASDLLALLKTLDAGPVRAIGYSSGAIALLELARLAPDQLEAMVLVDGTHRFSSETRAMFARVNTADWMSSEPRWWESVLKWHPGGVDQLRELRIELVAMAADPLEGAFTDEELRRIRVPTLIVHGDRDEVYPVDGALALQRLLPRAELWVMPGVGHESVFSYYLVPPGEACRPCEVAGMQFVPVIREFFGRTRTGGPFR
jgi:pimeloyl-ACP methyl ester carboxylesterase